MKFLICLALLVACASAAVLPGLTLDEAWHSYKATHGKTYSVNEDKMRRAIWQKNLDYVNKHNEEAAAGVHTYTLGMNQFADMTSKEFTAFFNGYNAKTAMQAKPTHKFVRPNAKLPDNVDWRDKGFVTPIKNQEQCGSCWAFSAVASLEGQHFNKTGQLVSLSEQNLVDCSGAQGNQGCNGGLMDQAFDYIKANNGIDTEESYPYKGVDQDCKFNAANVGATVTGYVDIEKGNEDDLTAAIAAVGPISVAIDASHISFQLYREGVYYAPLCSSTALDHGVTAVGYGVSGAKKDYYWVKNSWGTTWGMKGYIQMSRNRNNNCGIATSASYPLV
jgi:cathepsin L